MNTGDVLTVIGVAGIAMGVAGGLLAAAADRGLPLRRAVPVAAAVAFLAGCGVSSGPVPSTTPTPACVEEDGSGGPTPCVWDAQGRGNGRGTPVVIGEGAGSGFVADYRRGFPALAEGRSDRAIRDDGRNTCHDLEAGEPRPVLLRRVAARFEGHDGTAPTPGETAAILAAVRRHCSDLS